MPRKLARLTGWPFWSVSVKAGAVKSSGAALPSMACAMIGAAFGLASATAIGPAPTMTTAAAHTASTARAPAGACVVTGSVAGAVATAGPRTSAR